MPMVNFSPEEVEALADEVAQRVLARLADRRQDSGGDDGFLNPVAAARYLGVTRKRIYDLKSMGAIEPDGYDGRTPLFTRQALDRYARSRNLHKGT
jgi:hypothetical protein